MNEKEYRQLKELLRELEQKIDTLYENETEPPSSDQEPEPELKDASEPLFELEAEKKPEIVGDLFAPMANRPTVADSLAKSKNKGLLKDVIPLNDRLLYLKVLFSDKKDLYDTTLTRLQTFKNLQEAEDYLGQHFPAWELSSPAVQKFLAQLKHVF
ncbi:MAG: hypothetical protein WBK97_04755 [Bacteroidales bacterium]